MDSYRSLEAWKVAHKGVILAFRTCDRSYHPRVRSLIDQLRRAALSIEANIVEGYALGTATLFRRHARIALGSAAEAQCLVRNMGELGYMPIDPVREL